MPPATSQSMPLITGAGSQDIQERGFAVEGVTCAVCVETIERELAKLPGVVDARVNFSTRRLSVRWNGGENAAARVSDRLRKLGYRAHPLRKRIEYDDQKYAQWLLRCMAVSGFAAMNVMLLSVSVWAGNVTDITVETRDFFHWLSALIALPAVAYAGRPFFGSAFKSLVAGRVNMDVPISLGIMLALGLSLYETATHGLHAYFDSAVMLLFFLLVGRYLEQITRQRMRSAADNVSSLRALTATRIDGSRLSIVEADDLRPGDTVLIRPGDRFPADGVVVEGRGFIDESIANGETEGTQAAPGRAVLGGTLSIDGNFRVLVQARASNSFLDTVERLVDTAINSRLPHMQLADRAARLYAPVVHAAAVLTLAGWLFAGAGWYDAIVTAIAVLIITCPCALALAVPTVKIVAMGEMFRQKILVNSADLSERLSEINTVVFDKTGTLTLPELSVSNFEAIAPDLAEIAARLAAGSRHPLARALASLRGFPLPLPDIVEEPGQGVRAVFKGAEVRIGSADFCRLTPSVPERPNTASTIFFRMGERIAEFQIGQRVKDDAKRVISELRSAGKRVMIVSGDKQGPVESVAKYLGVDEWRATCSPQQKINVLEELRAQGCKVLMVGDGLNDAPALAAAHVSMSPVDAADLAQAQADAMFLGVGMRPVIDALMISLQAKSVMRENLALAIVYNVIAIPLAVAGLVIPLIAAAAMSGSSILVSANALRAKRWQQTPEAVLGDAQEKVAFE